MNPQTPNALEFGCINSEQVYVSFKLLLTSISAPRTVKPTWYGEVVIAPKNNPAQHEVPSQKKTVKSLHRMRACKSRIETACTAEAAILSVDLDSTITSVPYSGTK